MLSAADSLAAASAAIAEIQWLPQLVNFSLSTVVGTALGFFGSLSIARGASRDEGRRQYRARLDDALAAPLSADLRLAVGGWTMIAVYAVYGVFMTRTDLQERRLPDTLTLTLAAFLTGAVLALTLTAGTGTAAIAAILGAIALRCC